MSIFIMNIALIGMMGTMKTSVGKALADLTGMSFADSDDEFVRQERRSIVDVFASDGEEYFRKKESDIIKRLAAKRDTVISCGGGVPLRVVNVEALRVSSFVVLLNSSPERILERTSFDNSRPLLKGGGIEKIKALSTKRKPFYDSAADFVVDTTNLTPRDAAMQIIARVGLDI